MTSSSEPSADRQRLLATAAVIGLEFDLDVLAAAADRDQLECLDELGEARRAGLVAPVGGPERHRFVDTATHAEVLDGLPASARVHLHARVAEAIGAVHGDDLDAHVFELAGHWSAAAVGDYRSKAAMWVRRAADAALVRSAYDEAVRLYRRAIDIDDSSPPVVRCRTHLDLAVAAYRSSDVVTALEAGERAAELAKAAGRPDLRASAALVVEPTLSPELNLRLRRLCAEALDLLPATEQSLRLRVTARYADVCHYLGDLAAAHEACAALDRLGSDPSDLSAVVVALHAQQLDASGPEGVDDRELLAGRLAEVAAALGDPTESAWAHLWLVDVALERGDLAMARIELAAAVRAGADVADVIVGWQLLRAEATLAQAQARYADAVRIADDAGALLSEVGNPLGKLIRAGQLACVGLHTGMDDAFAAELGLLEPELPWHQLTGAVQVLTDVVVLLEVGRTKRAAALYRSLGPAPHWQFQPHSALLTWAFGVIAAIGLGERRDVEVASAALEPYRGHHISAGAGCVAYLGPVELWLGIASAHLGDLAAAALDLENAVAACETNGAAGFLAQAQLELARVIVVRAGSREQRVARALATAALQRAELLGMRPVEAAARELLERPPGSATTGLSPRELQVAGLVAEALSNRAIAQRLYLSERTVANHVQHIFDKLGFSNRSQVVAWVHERGLSSG